MEGINMYDEQIKALNDWIDDEEHRSFGTGRDDEGVYVVCARDVEDFCDFLRENVMDLIGIKCMVGNDGIWFHEDDLEDAKFY